MKVYICEDNVLTALDLEMMVEQAGHKPCGMSSGARHGPERAAEARAEAVLVDLELADGRTGPELALRFAEAGLPVVIVSGNLAEAPKHEMIVGVVAKPIEPRHLTDMLIKAERAAAAHSLGR